MEASQVNTIIAVIADKVKAADISTIKQALENAPESAAQAVTGLSLKNPTLSLILSLFLGYVGGDRFYLGQIGIGIAKLITCGGLGIWAIVDLFLIMGKTRELNGQAILNAINSAK